MSTATTTKAKPSRSAKPAAAAPEAAPEAAVVEEAAAVEETAVAAEAIEQAVAAGADAVEQAVKATQDAAVQSYDKVLATAKEQVEAAQQAQAQAVKSSEEALAAAKENLDAVIKAGQLLSKGLQDLSKSVVVLTQEAVEESLASTKKLLAAKTVHEAIEVQSAHAKAQIDRMLAEGNRITEASRKLFEEALAPIQQRVQSTMEKLSKLNRH